MGHKYIISIWLVIILNQKLIRNSQITQQLYLQGSYMTTLSVTGTLMNNYAAMTLLVDNFCSKTEVDSKLSDYIHQLK